MVDVGAEGEGVAGKAWIAALGGEYEDVVFVILADEEWG